MDQLTEVIREVECSCECHIGSDQPPCCVSCYRDHGINYRTFKNHIEDQQ